VLAVPGWLEPARYSQQHNLDGPRLRLGLVWFVVLFGAFVVGSMALLAFILAAVAGVGALQVSGAWRAKKAPVQQMVAAIGAALIVVSSLLGNRVTGFVMLLVVAAAVLLGSSVTPASVSVTPEALTENLVAASATLRSSLPLALAGVAGVQIFQLDPMAYLFLLSIVCVYDAGDYLCGAGYQSRIIGPIAGSFGVLVVTAAMTAINPPPLVDDGDVWTVGLLLAILCPLGTLVGSWMLPSATSPAPGLRRLDSWLLTAPVLWVILLMISGT